MIRAYGVDYAQGWETGRPGEAASVIGPAPALA